MSISTKINQIIEDGDKKVAEVAKQIGITRQQLARWRKGTSDPKAENLKVFCEIYGVSADYILGLPEGLSWPR